MQLDTNDVESTGVQWTWQGHILLVNFPACGHCFADRPPRTFMTAAEISRWLAHLYPTCPWCPAPVIDRRALLVDAVDET